MVNPLDELDFRNRVQRELQSFIDLHRPLMSDISSDAMPLVDSLNDLVSGGKRLRAAFAYWGARAVGAEDSDELIRACTSLEFLQACALIHDDVMDGSDTRRGKPAVHKQFEARHSAEKLQGDATSFGASAAILIGDLALAWADELLMTSGLDVSETKRAKDIYDVMRTELMAGQYLDVLEQFRRSASVDRARNVIRYKSAKYTIERPLHMGAAIAGADEGQLKALSVYGLALGEAFQLRDDVLGVFGDSATTGKPAGDDIREQKQTLLLAYALDSSEHQEALSAVLAKREISESDIVAAQDLIRATGAVELVEENISSLRTRAIAALSDADFTVQSRAALTELAIMATERNA